MKKIALLLIAILAFSAVSLYAQSAQTRLNNGKRLFDQSNYDGAIKELTEAIKLDPKLAEAYVLRARSYSNKNDYDLGFSDAEMAIRLNPKLAMGYFARAYAYDGKNDIDRAITDYTEAIRLDPKFAWAYNNRGIAYDDKKDYNRAIADYDKAIKLDSKFAMAYNNRGVAYINKGNYNRAIADFTKAIKFDPKFAMAYYNRGDAYRKKKDYNRAIADYTEAIKVDPKFTSAYHNRGTIYLNEKKDYDRAIADYTEAIRLDPKHANAYNNRGNAYRIKGDNDRAIADFTEANRLDPKYKNPYNNSNLAVENTVQPAQVTPLSPPLLQYWTGDGGKGLSLAVLEPTGKGLTAQEQWMLPLIQGSLTGDFNRYSAMTIVDRQNLEKILAEQSQSMSGNYSDNDYIRIGRLTNARLILTGSIARTASTFMLELSVADVETGERKASYPPKSVTPASVENLSAIKEAAADLLEQLGVTLTASSQQALRKPIAITVVQGQAVLAAPSVSVVQTGQQQSGQSQPQIAQQQSVQDQFPDAQDQLAEVQAQIALAKGIDAQKQGTEVVALSYFLQAASFVPSLKEAASRISVASANIKSGNIGVDTRNDIEWRKRWVARLTETEEFFYKMFRNAGLPYTLFYSTRIQDGKINYQTETIELSFPVNIRINSTWASTLNNAYKTLDAVIDGLNATERASTWGIHNWPLTGITNTNPFHNDWVIQFSIVFELLNDKNKVIGRQTINLTPFYSLYIKASYSYEYTSLNAPENTFGTVTFNTVKANDISDTMTIRVVSANGATPEKAGFPIIAISDSKWQEYTLYDIRHGVVYGFNSGRYTNNIVFPNVLWDEPYKVTAIGERSFRNASGITSIIIPASVTEIGELSFDECYDLTSVTFEGRIDESNFPSEWYRLPFHAWGDLRSKYFAGGPGIYTRTITVQDK